MKVLILSVSSYSLGELHNAILFAGQLQEAGVEALFFTAPRYLDYARGAGFPAISWQMERLANEASLRQKVREQCPEAVIIADYANLFLEKPVVSPKIFPELGVPVATFDSMGFAPGPNVLEMKILGSSQYGQTLYGQGKGEVAELPAFLPEITILRTCPINKPVSSEEILAVSLYSRMLNLPAERQQEIRQKYGLSKEEKLILLAKAPWARQAVKIRAMELNRLKVRFSRFSYEYFLKRLLQLYLREVEFPVLVLGVGDENLFPASKDRVRFASLGFLGFREYQELLLSADLFITDNITSCSAAKAVMGGVPALVLINSLAINEKKVIQAPFRLTEEAAELLQEWEKTLPGTIFPFYVYPFGWIKELAPLLEGNPYREALLTAEIFDLPETGRIIASLLTTEKAREEVQKKQASYFQQLAGLAGAVDGLHWVRARRKEN